MLFLSSRPSTVDERDVASQYYYVFYRVAPEVRGTAFFFRQIATLVGAAALAAAAPTAPQLLRQRIRVPAVPMRDGGIFFITTERQR